jgi:flagellum-specific peptidoglycan hydrolase FlgJ
MKTNADNLAKACVENYAEYGVLPSVCIGQAFIESHIGVDHSQTDYNWWGIASCNIGYSTFNDGVIGYLSTINNGYYPNAPFNTDPYSTISAIAPNYASSPTYQQDVTWAINAYNLTAYDDYLFDSEEYKEYLKSVKN